jgi:hypothetical protein
MDFKPHLLFNIIAPDFSVIISLLAQKQVLLAYDGKWCGFEYQCIEQPGEPSFFRLSIKLYNGFLHHGQFSKGQQVQFYHAGAPIATGIIEDVLEPCFKHWNSNPLPDDLIEKQWFPEHVIQPLVSSWIATLTLHPATISFAGGTAAGYELVLKKVPHDTLLLSQAQQICQTITSSSYNCCYKISYKPVAYGLIDLFLKEFSLTFVLHSDTHLAKGVITIT